MKRLTSAALACSVLGVSLPGCTGLITQRAVTAFARGLENKDLAQLKSSSSDEFGSRALRLPEATQDLRLVQLPTGKAKVVSIDESSPKERVVVVEVGESKKRVEYRLTRNPKKGRWVVDDVFVGQKLEGSSSEVVRSVTDQMNMLLCVREMLAALQSREREAMQTVTTPELAKELEGLPPAWLDKIASRVAGDSPIRANSFRPEVRMEQDRAAVGLRRGDGLLVMEFRNSSGRWLLNDASWSGGKEEEVSSVRKLCTSLTQARQFLEAYAAGDKPALAQMSTREFHEKSLLPGDLSRAPLPAMDLLTQPFDVQQHRERIDVLLTLNDTTYTLNIVPPKSAIGEETDPAMASERRVEEVTVYDRKSGEIKRLSAVFQSQAVVEVYSELLAARDAVQLRQLSTTDFNDRVWKRFPPQILQAIGLNEIETAPPTHATTVFQGPVTEVTVMQGSRALTYVLHSEGGRLVVDDVLMPVLNRPSSLKKTMQVLAPIAEFRAGLASGDRNALMAASGTGLDRIVWQQVQETPEIGVNIEGRLALPIHAAKIDATQSRVTLSNGREVAEVDLILERDRFVVEDVTFLEGPGQAPVAMLQAMRREIARDMQHRTAPQVLPASYERSAAAPAADDFRPL
ncbi:MAG: hypothetical protein KF774_02635 [Planctomyces sp.]|nr:hypothetical protein [Planctomyces sp.]